MTTIIEGIAERIGRTAFMRDVIAEISLSPIIDNP